MKTKILTLLVLPLILIVGCQSDPVEESSLINESGKILSKKSSGDLPVEVIRAPIVSDGTSAGAVTDIVLNFRDLDPDTNGITIKTGGSIEVELPDAFTNTGSGTNIGIILQGWPQSPPEPPPFTFWTTTVLGNTITITMLKDFHVGDFGPGAKQVHLALFGFRNPGPGMYPISLSIKPDPSSDALSGTGIVHIIPKARPAISAVSFSSGGGPPPPFDNPIYQIVEQDDDAKQVQLYLWESGGKPLVGADIEMENLTHGRLVKENGSTAGQVRISAPPGASDYSLNTLGPSTEGSAFLSGVPVGKLETIFTPDATVSGDYTIEISMNNGNTQYLYVEVIP
jgi:hypothetical protein